MWRHTIDKWELYEWMTSKKWRLKILKSIDRHSSYPYNKSKTALSRDFPINIYLPFKEHCNKLHQMDTIAAVIAVKHLMWLIVVILTACTVSLTGCYWEAEDRWDTVKIHHNTSTSKQALLISKWCPSSLVIRKLFQLTDHILAQVPIHWAGIKPKTWDCQSQASKTQPELL